jgi:hypothetical protein
VSVQDDNLRIARAVAETVSRLSEERASSTKVRTVAAYAEHAQTHPLTGDEAALRENSHLRSMLREAVDEWFLQVVNDG